MIRQIASIHWNVVNARSMDVWRTIRLKPKAKQQNGECFDRFALITSAVRANTVKRFGSNRCAQLRRWQSLNGRGFAYSRFLIQSLLFSIYINIQLFIRKKKLPVCGGDDFVDRSLRVLSRLYVFFYFNIKIIILVKCWCNPPTKHNTSNYQWRIIHKSPSDAVFWRKERENKIEAFSICVISK